MRCLSGFEGVRDSAPQMLLIGLSVHDSSCGIDRNFSAAVFAYRQMWQDTVSAHKSISTRFVAMRSRSRADSIAKAGHACDLGAVLAAKERAVLFEPVTDDTNSAVLACRSERVDRAFETVVGMGRAVQRHLKGLVVVVSAGFASGHDNLPCSYHLGVYRHNPRSPASVPAWAGVLRSIAAPFGLLREFDPLARQLFVLTFDLGIANAARELPAFRRVGVELLGS